MQYMNELLEAKHDLEDREAHLFAIPPRELLPQSKDSVGVLDLPRLPTPSWFALLDKPGASVHISSTLLSVANLNDFAPSPTAAAITATTAAAATAAAPTPPATANATAQVLPHPTVTVPLPAATVPAPSLAPAQAQAQPSMFVQAQVTLIGVSSGWGDALQSLGLEWTFDIPSRVHWLHKCDKRLDYLERALLAFRSDKLDCALRPTCEQLLADLGQEEVQSLAQTFSSYVLLFLHKVLFFIF